MFIVLSEVLKRLFLALCGAVFCVSLTAPTAVLAQVTPWSMSGSPHIRVAHLLHSKALVLVEQTSAMLNE